MSNWYPVTSKLEERIKEIEWERSRSEIKRCPICKHNTLQHYIITSWECLTCGSLLEDGRIVVNKKIDHDVNVMNK